VRCSHQVHTVSSSHADTRTWCSTGRSSSSACKPAEVHETAIRAHPKGHAQDTHTHLFTIDPTILVLVVHRHDVVQRNGDVRPRR
jgi:hypothetical protein